MAVYCLTIGIPLFMGMFFEYKNDNKKINKLLNVFLIVTMVNAIVLFVWLFLREYWTAYEFLLLNAGITVTFIFILKPFKKFGHLGHCFFLKWLCAIVVCIAIYSTVTFGQTNINSDTATSVILAQSQIDHKSIFPQTWNYVNGDIWVLCNHTFIFPFVALMKNMSLARMLGAAFLVLCMSLGIIWQSKSLFKTDSWVIALPVVLLILTYGSRGCVLDESSYSALLLWLALNGAFGYFIVESSGKKYYYIMYFILTILLNMGGIRFLAELTLPLIVAALVEIYIDNGNSDSIHLKIIIKKTVKIMCLITIPAIIGYGIYKWLCTGCTVVNTNNNSLILIDSLNACFDNARRTLINLFDCFGYFGLTSAFSVNGIRDMISITICFVVVFLIPVLQGLVIKKEDKRIRFFYLYGISHNIIMIILNIFFQKDITSRYLVTTVFISIIISSRYIYDYWINNCKLKKYVWVTLFFGIIIFESYATLLSSIGWKDRLNEKKELAMELSDLGLTKGYATYWNAYVNEVYSDLKLRMGGVLIGEGNLSPYRWLVDNDFYNVENVNTFLLLSQDEKEVVEGNHLEILDDPIETAEINGMYVYIYDFDIGQYMLDNTF